MSVLQATYPLGIMIVCPIEAAVVVRLNWWKVVRLRRVGEILTGTQVIYTEGCGGWQAHGHLMSKRKERSKITS